MKREDIEFLIAKHLEGDLSQAEAETLLAEVRASEEVRRLLARHLFHERTIQNVLASMPTSTPHRLRKTPTLGRSSARRRAWRVWSLSAAAALMVVALGGILFLAREKSPSIARVDLIKGQVILLPEREEVATEQGILRGQGLETVGGGSKAGVVFPDGTRLELGPETALRDVDERESGKRVSLSKGALKASVFKQPPGRPLIFSTPHGEAKVLGTTLRIVVDPDPKKGTTLSVDEGKVELKNLAGRCVIVPSGHYAVAAAGVELTAKAIVTPLSALAKLRPNTWIELEATYSVPPNQGSHTPAGWTKAVYDSVAGRILVADRWTDSVRLDSSYANAVIEFVPATGRASLVRIGNWRKVPTPDGYKTTALPENGPDPTPCDRMPHGGVAFVPFQNALYLTNGANQTAPGDHGTVRDTWRLDLATKRWTKVPSAFQPPNELEDCMTCDEGVGKLVYFAHASANQPETWVMDLIRGEWTRMELTTQPPGRMGGAMAYDPVRRRSLLFGGGIYPNPGRDLWAYDAKANAWTRLADAPVEARDAGFAYDSRHDVFLASFRGQAGTNRTLVFRAATNTWSEILPPAGERWPDWSGASQAMAYDPASDVFVFLGGGPEWPRWFIFRYVP